MEFKLNERWSWTIKQSTSLVHLLSLGGFGIIILMSLKRHLIGTVITLLIFLIATTFSQIKGLLVAAGVVAFLSALFPPLAGILGVIAIIMFIIKLKFLIQNWRAVLAGLFIYIYPFCVNSLYNKNLYSYYNSTNKLGYVISGILLFQLVMTFLYYYGYSSKGALAISGMLPLMIIIFLLPSVIAEIQGSIQGFENYNSNPTNNPNIHSVKGHYRQTPSGGVTYVEPHIRTNPDGIESNNISYKK